MWIGLGLGLLLVLLGLSGSVLVYDDDIADLIVPAAAGMAQGPMLSLDAIIAAARAARRPRPSALVLPQAPGEAASGASRRDVAHGGDAGSRRGRQRGRHGEAPAARARRCKCSSIRCRAQVLGSRKALLPPILAFAHQLHGNFLMGREGRRFRRLAGRWRCDPGG